MCMSREAVPETLGCQGREHIFEEVASFCVKFIIDTTDVDIKIIPCSIYVVERRPDDITRLQKPTYATHRYQFIGL